MHVDIQALQVSPLAGRIFFKGVRYHGRNESILIQDGHITWRYWLRRVQDLDYRKPLGHRKDGTLDSASNDGNTPEQPSAGEESTASQRVDHLPCRIMVKARGLQWFVYNRSPAYDGILRSMLGSDEPDQDRVHTTRSDGSKAGSSRESAKSTNGKDEPLSQFDLKENGHALDKEALDTVVAGAPAENSLPSNDRQANALPSLLNILPIGVECGKAALVMGNQSTQSILVAKADTAIGQLTARPSRSVDLYRQVIDFDFAHPSVHFKVNQEYTSSSFNEGARLCSLPNPGFEPKTSFWNKFTQRRRPQHTSEYLKEFLPYGRASNKPRMRPHSILQGKPSVLGNHLSDYNQNKWLGLARYLDGDDDRAEQECWKLLEYAQVPNIVDCPAISMSFFWDVPGLVQETTSEYCTPAAGYETDINGGIPPDWGIELKVRGGIFNYGPWADRQRVGLQSVFFPMLYSDAVSARKLQCGVPRVSTELKVIVIIEEQVTLRVPIREDSKDWKWKRQTSSPATTEPKHTDIDRAKGPKHTKALDGPSPRPFGWLDVKILPDSTISFAMDLVANSQGYRNRVDVDLKGVEMTSSVNHALVWRSESQIISCNFSNPLGWNALRQWHIVIEDEHLELYLLRDHMYLMMDLINDWGSAPSGEFHTFIPFEYSVTLRLKNFRLYLNANDSNIVDNPADPSDNTFVVVWGKEIVADLLIPMTVLHASRIKIDFDIDARDGGFEFLTPSWNTQNTFLDNADVAALTDLRVVGSYTYSTITAPNLTDILVMDVYGTSPRIHLHGFLIRYLVNVKDNYFGEDMHFRTLEEYQRQLASVESADDKDSSAILPKRLSNDLDVVLMIKADDLYALLPVHLYSAAESISLETSSISADLRINNYYMDLAVSSNPVSMSRTPTSRRADGVHEDAKTEVFVDGIKVLGHRLFGLPPSEPTYVCNWDFEVGDASGEFSIAFLRELALAMQCFVLSFNDNENALPQIGHTRIHDITFLRASVRAVSIALRVEEAAFLLYTGVVKVNLNDLVGQLFSDRLHALIPELTLAVIECHINAEAESAQSPTTATYAYLKTSMEFNQVTRKLDFQQSRHLQQKHVALHDSRTRRVSWLRHPTKPGQPSSTSTMISKPRVPAMPYPVMPSPMFKYGSVKSTSRGSVSINSRKASFVINRATSQSAKNHAFDAQALDPYDWAYHDNFEQHRERVSPGTSRRCGPLRATSIQSYSISDERIVQGGDHIHDRLKLDRRSFASSSAYQKPYFPSLAFVLDTSDVPKNPSYLSRDDTIRDDDTLEQFRLQTSDRDAEQVSSFIRVDRGIQALCMPEALLLVARVQEQLQTDQIISMLDRVQIDATRDVLNTDEKSERAPSSKEFRLFAPFIFANFSKEERFEICIKNIALTSRLLGFRSWETQQSHSHQLTLHVLIDQIDCSVRKSSNRGQADQTLISLQIYEPMLWLFRDSTTTAEIQFVKVEASGASRKVDYIYSLIRRTLRLSDDLRRRLSSVSQRQKSRLRLLVLLLTKEGDTIPDPPFLNTASYVLRSAKNHLRESDSWRMMSRLRYVQSCLSDHAQDRIYAQCVHKWASCPKNAGNRVVNFFEQWRTCDLANVRSSLLMQKIYGELLDSSLNKMKQRRPLQISVSGRCILAVVDPGPSQSEVVVDECLLGLSLNQNPMKDCSQSQRLPSNTVQACCVKIAIRLNWGLCDLLEYVVETAQSAPLLGSRTVDLESTTQSAHGHSGLHVLLSSEMNVLNFDTINLKSISILQGLKASVIHLKARDALSNGLTNLVIDTEAFKSELYRHTTMLSVCDMITIRLFGSQDSTRYQDLARPWIFVGSGRKFSYQVVEPPLEVTEVVDNVIQGEIVHLLRLTNKLSPYASSRGANNNTQELKGLPKAHIAFVLDSYQIEAAILPSLVYQLNGGGIRSSIRSGLSQDSAMNIMLDLKQHLHVFTSNTIDDATELSTMHIPPISGDLKLVLATEQRVVIFRFLVERINLNASSIHAILDAVYRPAIIGLCKEMRNEISLIQQHVELMSGASELKGCDDSSALAPILYDANATIAGLTIRASTPEIPSSNHAAEMEVDLGRIQMLATNIDTRDGTTMVISELRVQLKAIKGDLLRPVDVGLASCGRLAMGFVLTGTSKTNGAGKIVRCFLAEISNLDVNIYTETASIVVTILGHLQDSLKTIEMSSEVKGLQRLGRERLRREGLLPSAFHLHQKGVTMSSNSDFSAVYCLVIANVHIAWKISDSTEISPSRDPDELILSSEKIDFTTKQDNAVRLLIENLQLQMAPASQSTDRRSSNSALLPEVVFNVAYKSTDRDRKLAFQAVGKSLDIRVTSQSIIPANDLRRSIVTAIEQTRAATAHWKASTRAAQARKKHLLGNKKLASLLIYADFAGAVVHIQGSSVINPPSMTLNVLGAARPPEHGRYNQFSSQNASDSSTILRAPGVALKVEFIDAGTNAQSLNAEMKVSASSNVLFPIVVPIVMEMSSSIKEIAGVSNDADGLQENRQSTLTQTTFLEGERLRTSNPSAVLGNCKLNLGLRICKQDFSLSCQPIARVAARACFEDIYITVSTVQSLQHGKFFTIAAVFTGLQVTVQHVYSRESTGSFEVDSIVVSCMNSRHVSSADGISAILKISPMRAQVNAKQLQDFLLFREIWIPSEIRQRSTVFSHMNTAEPQAYIMQRYQQIAATGTFPWNATASVAELDIQLDLGPSLGKSVFKISNFWISSRKSSDWEQNLCLGFERVTVDSTGRMSGVVEFQNFKIRTSILWPILDNTRDQTPLIQASIGFDQLRLKAGFEYQAFLIADVTTFEFLMYNVRELGRANRDRLVGVLDGGRVQVFCTATSASQAYALYQAFQRLTEEKQKAYETLLTDIEKFLRRKSSLDQMAVGPAPSRLPNQSREVELKGTPKYLQTDVVVTLRTVNLGAFPSTFMDSQIFKLEALEISARFAVVLDREKIHSTLGMTLGQLRVALSGVNRPTVPRRLGEVSVVDVVASATGSRGGTILKVPRLIATMQTWQDFDSTHIDYIFKSSFQGKVDVGWNYSRISYIRGMYANHVRALAQRLGKPLPPSAVQITGLEQKDSKDTTPDGEQEKITAVVNVPQSKYHYTALQPPTIETPQLRDMGEATPPLEWIGLQRDRLPNLTHQIVIVTLLEIAKEVDDAYSKILGSS